MDFERIDTGEEGPKGKKQIWSKNKERSLHRRYIQLLWLEHTIVGISERHMRNLVSSACSRESWQVFQQEHSMITQSSVYTENPGGSIWDRLGRGYEEIVGWRAEKQGDKLRAYCNHLEKGQNA